MVSATDESSSARPDELDLGATTGVLLRRLHSQPGGLSSAEAQRRLVRYGPNSLTKTSTLNWPRELAAQFTHPLALLLVLAASLAFVSGTPVLGWTIAAVVLVNASFAFAQERQAERAVEALREYLPQQASALRDSQVVAVRATELVPGDVIVVTEGQRISADAHILDGEVQVDLSTLTGESASQTRTAVPSAPETPLLASLEMLFSGTACTAGTCHALVVATGDHTELGRIASLSQRVQRQVSPLEHQVKKVAWLIALIAILVGAAFLPLGLLAGLSLKDAFLFAVGLLVANVPEGLLPTITLALAVGVRVLARRGAVVKRLSAVETLGSTTVICTDKTGTITQNKMSPAALWSAGSDVPLERAHDVAGRQLGLAMLSCATASSDGEQGSDDPTERAVLAAARALTSETDPTPADHRVHVYPFQSTVRMMSTVDRSPSGSLVLHTKGAPEAVLDRCSTWLSPELLNHPLDADGRALISGRVAELGRHGLRVLAVAERVLPGRAWPHDRNLAERDLRFLGLVALLDPPRPEVAKAISVCHRAGIRVHVITGDNPDTAAEIAHRVGIGRTGRVVLTGATMTDMSDATLAEALAPPNEVVCARSSPEDKLRITDVLQHRGEVVAMTGDGVNDAPALQRADIGVAMGRSGTDVAREAATAVLSDDNFATIAVAVEEGRRVYDNVRKFILYIFAHAVPEVVPFLLFAVSGGAIPLPLTVVQILAVDLGTETLPALALGREPAEPGVMDQPPRPRHESIVSRRLLLRAWGILGSVSALLAMGAFFYTLHRAGWHPGAPTGHGTPLHHAYLQATTATFAAIVACQIGTALAARTERASLRRVGLTSNRMLLWGLLFEVVFAASLIYLPAANDVMHTAPLPIEVVLLLCAFPVVVWGADECYRAWLRRRESRTLNEPTPASEDARG